MTDVAANIQPSITNTKKDTVMDLLDSVEKMKMIKVESPIDRLFDHPIKTETLKEKFLYTTFEIIADMGADALSASELIRRTKSSKGALFHHFDTIDNLCIESLHFFKKNLNLGLAQDDSKTLEEYLKHFMSDRLKKQSTKQYIHLVNFFRDRAVRDERYREPLKSFFDSYLSLVTDRVMSFLNSNIERQKVHDQILFMAMTVERVGYQRVLYQNDQACQQELDYFLKHIFNAIQDLK